MSHDEIVSLLTNAVDPSEVVHAVTVRDILSQIVNRLGEDALDLSTEDVHDAVEEVRIAINHNFDERELIDEGLDAWSVLREL